MTDETKPQGLPNNVIDFQTRQALLPSQIRAAMIGQYAESLELKHTPDQFANKLEERLFSTIAMAGARAIKKVFNEQFGGEDE